SRPARREPSPSDSSPPHLSYPSRNLPKQRIAEAKINYCKKHQPYDVLLHTDVMVVASVSPQITRHSGEVCRLHARTVGDESDRPRARAYKLGQRSCGKGSRSIDEAVA